jgi:hypothetical protein
MNHRIFLLSPTNWLQAFRRCRTWISARPRLVRFAARGILFAVLLTPSIWMLSVIPPLWRDVDAYVQVTEPPGPGTILQYGPLYSFVARIPLYIGYVIDCVGRSAPLPTPAFFIHPILTDSGVFVLLLLQHISLCLATVHFIAATTRLFSVRLGLAVAWVANPLFYTFAHCIGSETLSMILVLLTGATGLRIVRYSHGVLSKEWLLFGVLLWLCILDPPHQCHSDWAAPPYVPVAERLRVNHDRIRPISATAPLATTTGETGVTKSDSCCRRWYWLHRPSQYLFKGVMLRR